MNVNSPLKLRSGSSHLCPRKTLKFLLYMILSIGFLLLIDSQNDLNASVITVASFKASSTDLTENSPLRRSKQIVGVDGSNDGDGDELMLETTVGTSDVHIMIIFTSFMICVFCTQLLLLHIHTSYVSANNLYPL